MLYLGNSHTYFGIDPEYSKYKSFNAAHISQSLDFDLAILEKYKWSKLRCAVVPIDYFSVYKTLGNGIEKWRIKNYAIYYNINDGMNMKNYSELLNNTVPYNINRIQAYYLDHSSDITSSNLGWGTTYNSKENQDLIKTGKASAERHTVEIPDDEVLNDNVETLHSMIDFAKKHHIRLVFISCPAFKTYTQHLKPYQLNNTINIIRKLVSKNHNTAYYNLMNDPSFVSEDFYDADHLNEKGAKKLTLKIDSLVGIKQQN